MADERSGRMMSKRFRRNSVHRVRLLADLL